MIKKIKLLNGSNLTQKSPSDLSQRFLEGGADDGVVDGWVANCHAGSFVFVGGQLVELDNQMLPAVEKSEESITQLTIHGRPRPN